MKSIILLSIFAISLSYIPGIDVSVYQGDINWQQVKNAGIKFAIIRAGYGRVPSQKDRYFDQNYANAKAAGVPIGAYWYAYATNTDGALQEAIHV